ncbi:MAG: hypothetical protein CM1200mP16_05440 [Nitrospina sp.]|nr:MAG: hypothetical protein CM1200mP16_05440 [Nitrospina sp.]
MDAIKRGIQKRSSTSKRAIKFIKENKRGWLLVRPMGRNYIYGTFLAMNGLAAVGEDMNQPFSRKASMAGSSSK